jgi:hypothetical protein
VVSICRLSARFDLRIASPQVMQMRTPPRRSSNHGRRIMRHRVTGLVAVALWLGGCSSSGGSDSVEGSSDSAQDGASHASATGGGGGGIAEAARDAGALITIPLTVCNPNVYSAEMTIGGTQQFQLLLDTGSTTLAVAAIGCTSCVHAGVSGLYQPGPTAADQNTPVTAMYGTTPSTASGWKGEVFKDTVGVGLGATAELAQVKFGAMTQQEQFLVGTCESGTPGPVSKDSPCL